MADVKLDYGGASPANGISNDAVNNPPPPQQDAEMDAEMQDFEMNYNGPEADFQEAREQKLNELITSRRNRFYPLPAEQAIAAGANSKAEIKMYF